jgi:hypothetical protein
VITFAMIVAGCSGCRTSRRHADLIRGMGRRPGLGSSRRTCGLLATVDRDSYAGLTGAEVRARTYAGLYPADQVSTDLFGCATEVTRGLLELLAFGLPETVTMTREIDVQRPCASALAPRSPAEPASPTPPARSGIPPASINPAAGGP